MMISRMGIVRKKDEMSAEAFRKHWKEVHGPIVSKMTGLRRYHQNIVVDSTQLGIGFATRSAIAADGFSELWFDDYRDMEQGMASQVQAAKADMDVFLKDCPIMVLLNRPVIAVPADFKKPLIKRITLLKRKPEVSAEAFQWEWLGLHADLVKTMPHVIGYSQNVVIDRLHKGKRIPYADLPVDGVVEFWFEDVPSLEKCFASPEYATTGAHGKTFLDTMTTFLVEVEPLVG